MFRDKPRMLCASLSYTVWKSLFKKKNKGTSLVVQSGVGSASTSEGVGSASTSESVGSASTSGGVGSIPGWGTQDSTCHTVREEAMEGGREERKRI